MSGIFLCGLGPRPETDVSVETLEALDACDFVYADVPERSQFEWLRRLFPQVKRAASPERIVAAAVRRDVGLAVLGHPLYTSRLARGVDALARRRSIPVRMSAAVSPLSAALARAKEFLGSDEGWAGMQAYDIHALAAAPELLLARLPAVVYTERSSRADRPLLSRLVRERYPAKHPIVELDGMILIPPCA